MHRFRVRVIVVASAAIAALALPTPAHACRQIEVELAPARQPQVVVWIEDGQGSYVDTLYITAATGTYGLANRPGMMEFNSDWLWPYGRRETVFPVWAHRRGVEYPRLIFQDEEDFDLSHLARQSSHETYYCQPLCYQGVFCTGNEILDAGSCATEVHTDKGKFPRAWDGGPVVDWSHYPPRNDLHPIDNVDHLDSAAFADLNDLDAVSAATPPPGAPVTIRYVVPPQVPSGYYVVWIEVSSEFDQNGFYSYPSPVGIPYSEYGFAYRGQPSVLWSIPIVVGGVDDAAFALVYEGHGDPDGMTGDLWPADGTITTGVEGSGEGRLLVLSGGAGAYRVAARAWTEADDFTPPASPFDLGVVALGDNTATLRFSEPGDDGMEGVATEYEIRYLAGAPLTEENFVTHGTRIPARVSPAGARSEALFSIEGLAPETRYSIGVRAHDDCRNGSPTAFLELTTLRPENGEVACFVATAAHGSPQAPDVGLLRRFRDRALRGSIFGEIFVASYYSFGPALAEAIRPSELARAFARRLLTPLVSAARAALVVDSDP